MRDLLDIFPEFNLDKWAELPTLKKEKFIEKLTYYFEESDEAWKSTELDDFYLEELEDTKMSLEDAINDTICGSISDYDGSGDWLYTNSKTGKYYKGRSSFNLSMLNPLMLDFKYFNSLTELEKNKVYKNIINYLHGVLDHNDYKLIGIMWFNK